MEIQVKRPGSNPVFTRFNPIVVLVVIIIFLIVAAKIIIKITVMILSGNLIIHVRAVTE